ncbi:MAG: DVUA0089 family protein [Phycisphaerales bacterium]|nr:DVUA0089 family protein [Phycisphaerales bacterium]
MKIALLAGAAALALSGAAFGDVWAEQGDAGQSIATAQHTVGLGSLDAIRGHHDPNDVDIYCIRILDIRSFSASTVGGTSIDTQLFLFDANGYGVTHNDDAASGGTLQSTITGAFITSPGIYYLAISQYNADPSSISGLIWANSPFNVERAPDGPGAGDPLNSWSSSGSTDGDYSIALVGAGFCEIPAPGAVALLGLGGIAAASRRRRQA